jgi:hypothetical protein
MSANPIYKCEQCGAVLPTFDASCDVCEPPVNVEFTDLSGSQFKERFERVPLPRAFLAIARGAVVADGWEATGDAAPVVVTSAGQSLERDGCDFIRTVFLMLQYLDCPPSVRDFVLCIVGMTGGDAEKWHRITDQQIAEHMGYTATYIGQKRKELVEWERRKNMAVLEIKQGELDRSVMKYAPTEYRAPIIETAALFIRRVRSLPTKASQAPNAIRYEVERGHKEIAIDLAEDTLPVTPLSHQRNQRNMKPVGGQSSLTRFTERRVRLSKQIIEVLEAGRGLGLSASDVWLELIEEVQADMKQRQLE